MKTWRSLEIPQEDLQRVFGEREDWVQEGNPVLSLPKDTLQILVLYLVSEVGRRLDSGRD